MKKEFYLQGLLGLLILVLISAGCSKDEGEPSTELQEFTFDSEEVLAMLPAGLKNSTDTYARFCVGYVSTALDMSRFIGSMEVPDDAQRSTNNPSSGEDARQWTFNNGGQSHTFFWSFDEDNMKRYWSMDIQYGAAQAFNYVDAWEYKDGSGGEVLYNFNWVSMYSLEPMDDPEELFWKYEWRQDGAGNYTVDWYWESDSQDHEYIAQYNIMINADGSGSLSSYAEDKMTYQMQWDALGNGSWVMGEGELSGSWPAG